MSWSITSIGVAVGAFWMAYRFLLVGRKRGIIGLVVGAIESMLASVIITGLLSSSDVNLIVRPLVIIGQVGVAGLIGYEGRMAREAVEAKQAHETVERMRQFGEGIRPGEIDDGSD